MTKHLSRLWAPLCFLCLMTTCTFGATVYQTTLSASNEAPPTSSAGTGTATLTLSDDQAVLSLLTTFSGLSGPATMAHIHCCTSPGGNAGVVLPFSGFPLTSAGTYTNNFTLSTALSGITPAAFIAGLNAGTAYVNIHTVQNPAGEIRGFVTATPEPSTALLLAVPALGLFWMQRRRARTQS